MNRLPLLVPFLPLASLLSVAIASDDKLPPPEATEPWTPVPEMVEAAPDRPPSDAIVLLDGSSLDAWEPAIPDIPGWRSIDGIRISWKPAEPASRRWLLADGAMVVVPEAGSVRTRESFGDVQLHLEFRSPAEVKGSSQGRGNSGVFLMGLYEVQVLDSYDNPTYVNGQAGSIYKQYPPLVNASRPPGQWQRYDIVFIAPRFGPDGSVVSPARMTVFHNGVLVQHDVVVRGPTVWRGEPRYRPHPPELPLVLQDHGDLVSFRNIWIRRLALPDAAAQ